MNWHRFHALLWILMGHFLIALSTWWLFGCLAMQQEQASSIPAVQRSAKTMAVIEAVPVGIAGMIIVTVAAYLYPKAGRPLEPARPWDEAHTGKETHRWEPRRWWE